jgi:hypothetical protein
MEQIETSAAVDAIVKDLRGIFGHRVQSIVAYAERARAASRHGHGGQEHGSGPRPIRTLVVVDNLTRDDLRACAGRVGAWHDVGLATPLLLEAREFDRSLDAFPLEFGAIIADHAVLAGTDPFAGLTVAADDIRRAVEVQARGHLLHLREGFLETHGRLDALALLIEQSAPAFAALLASIARLDGQASHDAAAAARHAERLLQVPGGVIADVVALADAREISQQDADRLFPAYLEAVEKLVGYVDSWTRDGR